MDTPPPPYDLVVRLGISLGSYDHSVRTYDHIQNRRGLLLTVITVSLVPMLLKTILDLLIFLVLLFSSASTIHSFTELRNVGLKRRVRFFTRPFHRPSRHDPSANSNLQKSRKVIATSSQCTPDLVCSFCYLPPPAHPSSQVAPMMMLFNC